MLELELVCPPSPVQVTIARLVLVLGYDLALGLAWGLALWVAGTPQGLALLLSLRLFVKTAAARAYGGWLLWPWTPSPRSGRSRSLRCQIRWWAASAWRC